MRKSEIRLKRLLGISGVLYDATEYIMDSHFLPNDWGLPEENEPLRPHSALNIKDVEGDTWIKLEHDLGNAYVGKYFIPHVVVDNGYYFEINLEGIDDINFEKGIKSIELLSNGLSMSEAYDYPETEHPSISDIVDLDEEPFLKAMITKDFVYYMKGNEGDDNGTVKMFTKGTGELVSDNYRACQDMYENLLYNNFEWINNDLIYSRKEIIKEQGVELATEYHLSNMYEGKVNNLTFDGIKGALNKALEKDLGFKLDLTGLEKVHKAIKLSRTNSRSI